MHTHTHTITVLLCMMDTFAFVCLTQHSQFTTSMCLFHTRMEHPAEEIFLTVQWLQSEDFV